MREVGPPSNKTMKKIISIILIISFSLEQVCFAGGGVHIAQNERSSALRPAAFSCSSPGKNYIKAALPEEAKISQVRVKDEHSMFQDYLSDESRIEGDALKVFCPKNEAEVSTILKEANRQHIPVTVQGGRTGVVASAVPLEGWIISMEDMNKIKKVKKQGREGYAIVQPGVKLTDLEERAEKKRLFYPPTPTETDSCIGGNVNTNASGKRVFKYGPTRKYVRRLRIVLANGDVLDIRRGEVFADKDRRFEIELSDGKIINLKLPEYKMPSVRSSAGYFIEDGMDLIDLFIGSEGTLGVVTEIELGLKKTPALALSSLIFYNSIEEALDFIEKVRDASKETWESGNKKGIDLRAIEFIDKSALDIVRTKYKRIPSEAKCAVIIEQELPEEIAKRLTFENFCDCAPVADLIKLIGNNKAHLSDPHDTMGIKKMITKFRHDIPAEVNERLKFPKMGTDLIVPEKHLRDFVKFARSVGKKYKVPYAIWGHIGEIQLHVNFIPEDDDEYARALEAYKILAEKVVEWGGSIAAEHGIGKTKHLYLEIMFGEEAIRQMRRLKRQLDPNFILGRGNIFSAVQEAGQDISKIGNPDSISSCKITAEEIVERVNKGTYTYTDKYGNEYTFVAKMEEEDDVFRVTYFCGEREVGYTSRRWEQENNMLFGRWSQTEREYQQRGLYSRANRIIIGLLPAGTQMWISIENKKTLEILYAYLPKKYKKVDMDIAIWKYLHDGGKFPDEVVLATPLGKMLKEAALSDIRLWPTSEDFLYKIIYIVGTKKSPDELTEVFAEPPVERHQLLPADRSAEINGDRHLLFEQAA